MVRTILRNYRFFFPVTHRATQTTCWEFPGSLCVQISRESARVQSDTRETFPIAYATISAMVRECLEMVMYGSPELPLNI